MFPMSAVLNLVLVNPPIPKSEMNDKVISFVFDVIAFFIDNNSFFPISKSLLFPYF